MRLIEVYHPVMKVIYFGVELNVPVQTKYIATDENGDVYGYDGEKPVSKRTRFDLKDSDFESRPYILARVDLEGMHWRDTLIEVNQ